MCKYNPYATINKTIDNSNDPYDPRVLPHVVAARQREEALNEALQKIVNEILTLEFSCGSFKLIKDGKPILAWETTWDILGEKVITFEPLVEESNSTSTESKPEANDSEADDTIEYFRTIFG